MKELGPVIEKLLQQKKLWQQYRQNLIVEQWADLVGKDISRVTLAEKINKGKLWVAAKDSTWVYHLTLLKPKLLEQLNKHAGRKIVVDIHFHVGDLKRQENSLDTNTETTVLSSNHTESLFLNGIRKLKQLEKHS